MSNVAEMRKRMQLRAVAAALMLASVTSAALNARSPQMAGTAMNAAVPKEGEKAPDSSLTSLDGQAIRLSAEVARGPVVLVVLRGWPGYQCPFCTRQFGEYMAKAKAIEGAGAHVLFVYPGPADGLKAHAEAFTKAATLPAAYRVLLDPDYAFTRSYGLRWEARDETAYPSTFVIARSGLIVFARTSHEHGDRVPVDDVIQVLGRLPR